MVNEFISYVNEKSIELGSQIPFSAFETKNFLQRNCITLIKYATFYSIIQIFNYLLQVGMSIDSTLLESAVYGRNPEISHLIEDGLND